MFEENYSSEDDIPASVKHLYKQTDEGFSLVPATEFKTINDVLKVQEGLRKEREDHKATKKKLSAFGDLDATDIYSKLDRIAELEEAAKGAIDDDKINSMVETRIKTKTAPLERQLQALQAERNELEANITSYKEKDRKRLIHDHIRKAAIQAKIRDTALEDALLIGESVFEVTEDNTVVTKDAVGVTPGITPDVWFTEIKTTRPHWWPESQGVGATGGAGTVVSNNPFTSENWNLTEQGKLIKTDRSRAEMMAKVAGTSIGGKRPAVKK